MSAFVLSLIFTTEKNLSSLSPYLQHAYMNPRPSLVCMVVLPRLIISDLWVFFFLYNSFCKIHRISLLYSILTFLLSVKCDKQWWWQVLQSLNIIVLVPPAHSVSEGFLVHCKHGLHCGNGRTKLHKLCAPG